MTVRSAELLMAIVLIALSAYFMYEAAKLPIGWVPDEGPGGGFWPFWLSLGMLLSACWVLYNWVRRIGPIAQSTEPFFDRGVFSSVGAVAALLVATVALFGGIRVLGLPGIGVYLALPLFLLIYLKFFGGHGWMTALSFAAIVPVVTFLFFEILLTITLPKGLTGGFFEAYIFPLFYG
ncbi:MAG: tripartite tricarboxylate transporter TctB family protein [Pseudomonadota bacterium]